VIGLALGIWSLATWGSNDIRGNWEVTSAEMDGFRVSMDPGRFTLVIDRETIHSEREFDEADFMGGTEYRLEPSRSPKAINLIPNRGLYRHETLRGIYRVEGDTLTLCFAMKPTGERPKEFTAPRWSKRVLFVLKRKSH
jgi:uncharacterized protein (TIGR03067 family)